MFLSKLISVLCLIFVLNLQGYTQLTGWVQEPDLPGMSRELTSSFVIGDSAYVIGGIDAVITFLPTNEVWMFNAATGNWESRAGVPQTVVNAAAFSVAGKGYVSPDGDKIYEYDPVLDQWTQLSSSGFSGFQWMHTFVVNGKGYILDLNFGYLRAYDPVSDSWQNLTDGPSDIETTFVINNVAFGMNGNGELFEYDPLLDIWTSKASAPLFGSGWRSFTIYDKAYVTCGFDFTDHIGIVYRYDAMSDTWVTDLGYAGMASYNGTAFTVNDRGYICGGAIVNPPPTAYIPEMYSTGAVNTVSVTELSPSAISSYFNEVNGSLCIENGSSITVSCLFYDASGKVIRREQIPSGRHSLNCADLSRGRYIVQFVSEQGAHTYGFAK